MKLKSKLNKNQDITSVIIPRCYDSHIHWKSTGETLCQLNLANVKSESDLLKIKKELDNVDSKNKMYFRGDWLIGFGWDEHKFESQLRLHKNTLDQIFGAIPVVFSRADGHSIWVNSAALEKAKVAKINPEIKIKGGRVEFDENGELSGVFIDKARDLIESKIPKNTENDIKNFLLKGAEEFSNNGFTHIRDLDGSEEIWNIAKQLENDEKLKLFIEVNFTFESMLEFKKTLEFAKSINSKSNKKIPFHESKKKNRYEQIRNMGLKCYFDGALGSEGALLSVPYPSGKKGLIMYEMAELEEILVRTWSNNLPISIHTLGDEAVDKVVNLAIELKQKGVEGLLNLEHCEVVRPDTIKKMKALEIYCHLQPSHFLTDKKWLKEKLTTNYMHAFPWRSLEESGIKFFFGSDSPIEPPQLQKTILGIEAAEKNGILKPSQAIWNYHSHPDGNWGTDCYTKYYSNNKIEVHFSNSFL